MAYDRQLPLMTDSHPRANPLTLCGPPSSALRVDGPPSEPFESVRPFGVSRHSLASWSGAVRSRASAFLVALLFASARLPLSGLAVLQIGQQDPSMTGG
jgi:hypothetical protein